MADYNILHQKDTLFMLKNVELWVYVVHDVSQQSAFHNHALDYMSVQN